MTAAEPKFHVSLILGHSEARAWFEASTDIAGNPILVGMGSRTDYNKRGELVSHKVEPTGLIVRNVLPPPSGPTTKLRALVAEMDRGDGDGQQ